jgi:hypothetical protein
MAALGLILAPTLPQDATASNARTSGGVQGSLAACLMSKIDARLGRITTFGAAFVALSATKTDRSSEATLPATDTFVR